MIARALLYVGGHAENVALLEAMLAGREDLVLLWAADAKLGVKLASARAPEVILIDVDLAGKSALEFMQVLRADRSTATTPILALGANVAPEVVVKALEAGFFYYLTKPLQAGLFTEALDFALEFAAVERAEYNPLKESR